LGIAAWKTCTTWLRVIGCILGKLIGFLMELGSFNGRWRVNLSFHESERAWGVPGSITPFRLTSNDEPKRSFPHVLTEPFGKVEFKNISQTGWNVLFAVKSTGIKIRERFELKLFCQKDTKSICLYFHFVNMSPNRITNILVTNDEENY